VWRVEGSLDETERNLNTGYVILYTGPPPQAYPPEVSDCSWYWAVCTRAGGKQRLQLVLGCVHQGWWEAAIAVGTGLCAPGLVGSSCAAGFELELGPAPCRRKLGDLTLFSLSGTGTGRPPTVAQKVSQQPCSMLHSGQSSHRTSAPHALLVPWRSFITKGSAAYGVHRSSKAAADSGTGTTCTVPAASASLRTFTLGF
jgi:hypothetical protein